MSRNYRFHRENCDCFIRETIVDVFNRTIVLAGQHAFEWTITIHSETITKLEFPNGRLARKEFKKYKKFEK